jgi:hypothetical protein
MSAAGGLVQALAISSNIGLDFDKTQAFLFKAIMQ